MRSSPIVLGLCLLLTVLATSFAFAAETEPTVPVAPTSPAVSPGQPEEPLVIPGLIPEPAPVCIQCTVQQERECDAQCVLDGHVGGACSPCSLSCRCIG